MNANKRNETETPGTFDTRNAYATRNGGFTMNTMKRVITLGLIGISVAMTGCGGDAQQIANENIDNPDIASAISNEINETGQYGNGCQLGAISRRMGTDNKLAFLAEIKSGCDNVSTSATNDWQTAWADHTDMTFDAYRDANPK